jgi:hypothetical protein
MWLLCSWLNWLFIPCVIPDVWGERAAALKTQRARAAAGTVAPPGKPPPQAAFTQSKR